MAGGQGNTKLRFIKFHFNCSPWAEWRITHPGLGGIEVAPHNVCYSQVPIKRVGPKSRGQINEWGGKLAVKNEKSRAK